MHPGKPWAVGCEIRPGYLKVTAYVESKRLADMLAKRLGELIGNDLMFEILKQIADGTLLRWDRWL
jgi:hypothetical protein